MFYRFILFSCNHTFITPRKCCSCFCSCTVISLDVNCAN